MCDGVNHLYFQIGNVVVGEIKLMYAEIVSFIMHDGIAMMVDAFSETFFSLTNVLYFIFATCNLVSLCFQKSM